MSERRSSRGFSLLEALVATTVLTVGVVGLAQLSEIATRATAGAKATTFATILAQQKMEQLRSLTFGFDPSGLPQSDVTTDVSVIPERPTGGRGLSPSPAGALNSNTPGYCDFLDSFGHWLGGGSGNDAEPVGTEYIRRWSIDTLPANPGNTIVLQVLVTRHRVRGAANNATDTARLPDEARLVCVRTRKLS